MKGCDLVRVTAGTPPERPGRSVTPPEAGGGSSPAGPYYPNFTDERLRLGLITCCCGRWGCSAPTPHSTTSVPPGPTANCQHLHLLPVVCFWSPKLTLPMDTAGPSAAGVNAPTSSPQPMVTRVGAQTPQLPSSPFPSTHCAPTSGSPKDMSLVVQSPPLLDLFPFSASLPPPHPRAPWGHLQISACF